MQRFLAAALGLLAFAAPAGAAGPPAPARDGVVVRVNEAGITRSDFLNVFKQGFSMLHAYRMKSHERTFLELLQQRIDTELLHQEAVRAGLDREVTRGVFRFRRNAILAADFIDNVLRPAAAVTEEEVAAKMPHDLRTLKIRQILLETAEQAEEARRRLGRGEDFVALVRELSIGPEARKDGMLADYRADGGIYEPEIERYIFRLPLQEPSHVIRTGIGYAVLRVEAKVEPKPLEIELMRNRLRGRLERERLRASLDQLLKQGERSRIGEEDLFALVEAWLKTGTASTREVGRAAGNVITFAELVEWLPALNLPPVRDGSAVGWHNQFKQALTWQLDDSILAAEAARRGRKPGLAAEAALNFHLREATLRELRKRRVSDTVVIGPEELRPYWEQRRAEFDVPEQVEVRHLLVKDAAEARRLLEQTRAGEPLAGLAAEHSIDEATKAKGGYLGFIARGRTVAEFEKAAFALRKPGELAPAPVETRFGFHLIELVSRREARPATFELDREAVEKRIRAERESAAQAELLERLKKAARIVFDEKELSALREQFLAAVDTRVNKPKAPPAHH